SQPRRKTFVRIGDTGLRIHRRRSTELRPGKPYFSRREFRGRRHRIRRSLSQTLGLRRSPKQIAALSNGRNAVRRISRSRIANQRRRPNDRRLPKGNRKISREVVVILFMRGVLWLLLLRATKN